MIPQRHFLLLAVQILKKQSSKTLSPSPPPSCSSLISYSGSLDSPLGAYFSVNYLSPVRCSAATKGEVHEPRQNSSNRTTPLKLFELPSSSSRTCCFLSHSARLCTAPHLPRAHLTPVDEQAASGALPHTSGILYLQVGSLLPRHFLADSAIPMLSTHQMLRKHLKQNSSWV